jgi:hypothetical protein
MLRWSFKFVTETCWIPLRLGQIDTELDLCHGQCPVISTSNEKLKKVRMRTIAPSTATLTRGGFDPHRSTAVPMFSMTALSLTLLRPLVAHSRPRACVIPVKEEFLS